MQGSLFKQKPLHTMSQNSAIVTTMKFKLKVLVCSFLADVKVNNDLLQFHFIGKMKAFVLGRHHCWSSHVETLGLAKNKPSNDAPNYSGQQKQSSV